MRLPSSQVSTGKAALVIPFAESLEMLASPLSRLYRDLSVGPVPCGPETCINMKLWPLRRFGLVLTPMYHVTTSVKPHGLLHRLSRCVWAEVQVLSAAKSFTPAPGCIPLR